MSIAADTAALKNTLSETIAVVLPKLRFMEMFFAADAAALISIERSSWIHFLFMEMFSAADTAALISIERPHASALILVSG